MSVAINSNNNSDAVFIIPHIHALRYNMSNVYFKERNYRKLNVNDTESEYASTQLTYINNELIMNGLTFLTNSSEELNAYAVHVERDLLNLYAETYRVNKKAHFIIQNDISKMKMTAIGSGVYVYGIWESTSEYGLEYKWLEIIRQL
jgi:hypothetical protein